MFSKDRPQSSPILLYHSPTTPTYRGFISIPHSGEWIPDEFHPFLSGEERAYKEDVDFAVHELVDIKALQEAGVAVLQSKIHRVAVDLNRNAEKSVLHWEYNTKGQKIRVKTPTPAQEEELLAKYYFPYYELVKSSILELQRVAPPGHPVPVIDLHSMPSRPTDYHLKINPNQKQERPDFCVSDLRGKSCRPDYIQTVTSLLSQQGYGPLINDPYFGGHVTEYMHQFPTNAIQIEIKRGLYMDEGLKVLLPEKAEKLRKNLTSVLIQVFDRFSGINQK